MLFGLKQENTRITKIFPKFVTIIETPLNIKDPKILADVVAVEQIPIVNELLNVICRSTGMGLAAIARVTEDRWVTCSSLDKVSFGLKPGDEIPIEKTICQHVRQTLEPVFIGNVKEDPVYAQHKTLQEMRVQSYVSVPIKRKNGEFFGTLCAFHNEPAVVNTPELQGMFRLFSDLISFHLEAVEEKNAVAKQLKEEQEVAQLREQFIAVLGHDLRNPIASTRMSADILLHKSKDEMIQRHAKMIKSTSYRMEKLIGNMLDFARGRLGEGIILERKNVNGDLADILQQQIEELQNNSPERVIDVELNLDTDIYCDKHRIAQLFSNLLSNADLHGAQDHPVKVRAHIEGDKFLLSVENAGAKIPEEAKKQLFKPFYREGTGKKGLGLGLFIASEIARAHEGDLLVKSDDVSTLFTFSMPVKEAVAVKV